MRGRIGYADSGGISIAYRVTSEGPLDLVLVRGFVSHLETRMDDVRAVMDTVGSECAALFGYFDSGPMCVEVPGTSTLPWLDWKPLLAEVQEFLTGTGHLSWATVSSRRFSSRTSSARPRSFGRSVTRPGPAYCRHITRP